MYGPPDNFIRNVFVAMINFLSYHNLFTENRLHHPF
jgi:hypothetical protein